jgi:putative Holliday junction resolvase
MAIVNNIDDFIESIKFNQRLLAIDFGTKKIGLALSDTSGIIASPFKLIIRKSFKKDIKEILDYIKSYQIVGLVMGLPLQMNGIEGEICILVREFVAKLIIQTSIPIYLQDERLSSKAANRVLETFKINRTKRNLLDDKIAACFMLQGVLDQINYVKKLK